MNDWTKMTALALTAVLGGCANPADEVPAASVNEASAEEAAGKAAPAGRAFVLTEASTVGFTGSKVTGSHDGGVKEIAGELIVGSGGIDDSSVRVEMNMHSLWSDNGRLTGHLKSPDFFDVAKFPTASFRSTAIRKGDAGHLVTGDLTMHGVTKSITFPAAISLEENRAALKADFAVNRFDFDIKYPGRSDDLIREEVVVRLDIAAEPGRADFEALLTSAADPPEAAAAPSGGGFDRAAMMKRFDANGDGTLDDTERAAMRKAMGAGRPQGGS